MIKAVYLNLFNLTIMRNKINDHCFPFGGRLITDKFNFENCSLFTKGAKMPKYIFPPFNEKYIRSTPESAREKCFLHIYGAGIVYPDARYEFEKIRDSYIFEYIVSGQGYVGNKKETVRVTAGDCIVSAMDGFTRYGSDKKDPYVKIWFSVTGDFIKPLYDACLSPDTDFVVKKVDVYQLFEKMLAELDGNPKDNVSVLAPIILDILLAVSGRGEQTMPFAEARSRALDIKQYIDTFLLDNISIRKAAEHIGITERTAVKAFRDKYGITPSKYIRRRRLESAKELLENSDKSVTDIAHILHYCDQSYFSTEFKKEFGVYPSEYRDGFKNEKNVEKFI